MTVPSSQTQRSNVLLLLFVFIYEMKTRCIRFTKSSICHLLLVGHDTIIVFVLTHIQTGHHSYFAQAVFKFGLILELLRTHFTMDEKRTQYTEFLALKILLLLFKVSLCIWPVMAQKTIKNLKCVSTFICIWIIKVILTRSTILCEVFSIPFFFSLFLLQGGGYETSTLPFLGKGILLSYQGFKDESP